MPKPELVVELMQQPNDSWTGDVKTAAQLCSPYEWFREDLSKQRQVLGGQTWRRTPNQRIEQHFLNSSSRLDLIFINYAQTLNK
jgi:hypothetical protein